MIADILGISIFTCVKCVAKCLNQSTESAHEGLVGCVCVRVCSVCVWGGGGGAGGGVPEILYASRTDGDLR